MEKITKRLIGKEDIAFDVGGISAQDKYTTPEGSEIKVTHINAKDIPLTQELRNDLYGAVNVEEALRQIKTKQDQFSVADIMTENTTVNFSASDTVTDIINKINLQKKNLGGFTLTFVFPTGVSQKTGQSFVFENFFNGKLIVMGESTASRSEVYDLANITAIFKFNNCMTETVVKNFYFVCQYSLYAVSVKNSPYVEISNCNFSGNNNNDALFYDAAEGKVNNCNFYSINEVKISSIYDKELNKYLPLTGGVMQGGLTFPDGLTFQDGSIKKNDDAGYMAIFGGSAYRNGATVYLYGKENSDYPGLAYIRVDDGVNTKQLTLKPDGTATWDGKNIVCVQSWQSGSSWYRKYADGFIEQGGVINMESQKTATVTLHSVFTGTNYQVQLSHMGRNATADYNTPGVEWGSMTTTSFKIGWINGGETNRRVFWRAYGY